MSLQFRRRGRPRGNAGLTAVDDAEWLSELRTGPADGTAWPAPPDTIEFAGASDIGVMPEAAIAITVTSRDTQPSAKLRARPAPHEGYAPDTTGPLPALTEPPAIGDALARDDEWGPKLAPLTCGKCGSNPLVPDYILDRTRTLGHVNWLAFQAGWKYDAYLIWTCPGCQHGGKHRAEAS